MEGNPRTNNSVEGAHNKLHSFFNCDLPGFFKFLDLLRRHITTLESDVFDLRANKPLRPVNRAWKLIEERRVAAVEHFNENDVFGFLRTMANVLAA
uniref:Transposase n=1 Tax=Panagrolaimus sp. PS1159 TaxID=55785 RepID=A0AC35GHH5_9BILA